MKKIALLLIVLISLITDVSSQVHAYDNNHVGISYAYYNPIVEDLKSEGFTIQNNSGTFGLDFTYGIVDKIALGMQFNYSHVATDLVNFKVGNGNYFSQYKANIYQLWLKGDYHYSDDNFYEGTFYSSVAIGYMYSSSLRLNEFGTDNKNIPMFRDLVYGNGPVYQVYPIGYKSQFSRRFGGFIELGFGYQGIAKTGLYWRIDRSGKRIK